MVFLSWWITPNSGLTGPNNTLSLSLSLYIYIYIYIYILKNLEEEHIWFYMLRNYKQMDKS